MTYGYGSLTHTQERQKRDRETAGCGTVLVKPRDDTQLQLCHVGACVLAFLLYS